MLQVKVGPEQNNKWATTDSVQSLSLLSKCHSATLHLSLVGFVTVQFAYLEMVQNHILLGMLAVTPVGLLDNLVLEPLDATWVMSTRRIQQGQHAWRKQDTGFINHLGPVFCIRMATQLCKKVAAHRSLESLMCIVMSCATAYHVEIAGVPMTVMCVVCAWFNSGHLSCNDHAFAVRTSACCCSQRLLPGLSVHFRSS